MNETSTLTVTSVKDLRRIESTPLWERIGAQNVPAALENVAARYPDRPALTFLPDAKLDTAPDVLRYGDLMRKIRQAANLFRALGADEHNAVAFLLPPIPAAYITLWAAETASRACPINYLLDTEHIAHLLEAAGATILVALAPCDALDIWSKVATLQERVPGLQHVIPVSCDGSVDPGGFDALVAQQPDAALAFHRDIGPDDVAALFHTGGTTGTPKLAQHTHGNQLHASWGASVMYRTTCEDAMINGFPLFHVAGSFVFGLSTLLAGGNVILPSLLGMRDKAFVSRYWQFAARERATLLAGVPTVVSTLLDVDPAGADISRVRCMLTGGSPLPTELAASFERRLGIPVRNILGMTECAGVVSIVPVDMPRKPGSRGLPVPYSEVRVLRMGGSLSSGDFCAPGESGIVVLRGPNVSPGYTHSARNPGTFEDGWLISGDIGHIADDGQVHLTGRAKDVIIRSSHNIDPSMIEEALMRHPSVESAAAVGEPDEYAGELPVAFVTLRADARLSAEELLEFAVPYIGERPAVPKRISIIEHIPVTPVGKIYKPALRLMAMERAIGERVAQCAVLGHDVVVSGVDHGARLSMQFVIGEGAQNGDQLERELERIMAPFPIAYSVIRESGYHPPL
ncbi:AMP-binding protein [Cupriavidus consociatus]|uniref:AMP-binding protein n=1 Tax=Cupriavidus consociatus TaxID=2821357 RepID=UPI001AE9DF1E|nr:MULTISPECIES: AMP-binding protein [unclassified Cupriavidus]MBP0620818.1 AMP-binding protein [Cupriavidus sp. LEh25]MDK2657478.1 AMP-binding protein [Cupriavidus sp. LEh21]